MASSPPPRTALATLDAPSPISDDRFAQHLQRNLADAARRAAVRAQERCRLERAISLWANHGRRLIRDAWLDHNGKACGCASPLRLALRTWFGLVVRANQKAMPRALALLSVLLRTRTKTVLAHWAEEASHLAAIGASADAFWPRFRRGCFQAGWVALECAVAWRVVEQTAAVAASRSRAGRYLRCWRHEAAMRGGRARLEDRIFASHHRRVRIDVLRRWGAEAAELGSSATLLELAHAFAGRAGLQAATRTWWRGRAAAARRKVLAQVKA